jgi:hypothetical protein
MRQLGFDRQAATDWACSAWAYNPRWSGRGCVRREEAATTPQQFLFLNNHLKTDFKPGSFNTFGGAE